MPRIRRPAIAVLLLSLAAPLAPARADDATDQMKEAIKAYEKNDFATALTALDAATALVRQKRAERWQSLLPDPLSGWKADPPETTAVAPAVLGGGTSVTRTYRRGSDTVEISLLTDSPLMQGLSALMAASLFSNNDMKVLVIDGRKVVYTKNDNTYQAAIAGKVMVSVKASPGLGEDVLKAYWGAIKFPEIEKNAQ